MSARKQIIEERVEHLCSTYGDTIDLAFLKFSISILAGIGYEDVEIEDIVDGTSDKQIDAIIIDEIGRGDEANVFVIQAHNHDGFASTKLALMGTGLLWLFERPRADYAKLANPAFVRKIKEARELRNKLGPSNLHLKAFFVSKGDSKRQGHEFAEELKALREKWSAAGFGSLEFEAIGSSELVDRLEKAERKSKQVDDAIKVRYDTHVPSYIRYSADGINGYIVTVPAREIARLVSEPRDESIFDLNLRRYYGKNRGRVNPEIATTCTTTEQAAKFWFFNNGITVVCDRVDFVPDRDNPHVKLMNAQIVNGCQTSMTLHAMFGEGKLLENVDVLVKIFQTNDEGFVGRLVLTTNNQNAISSRHLRANDRVQQDYQRAFRDLFDLYYERKQGEFRKLSKEDLRKVVSNEKVGQAYLAIVKKRPTMARTQKYRIWENDIYREVFVDSMVQRHVLSFLIYDFCNRQKRIQLRKWNEDDARYSIVSYGVFHLARVAAWLFTKTETWEEKATNDWISVVRNDPNILVPHYEKAVALLNQLIRKQPEWLDNINNVFKASDIESAINRRLNRSATKKTRSSMRLKSAGG